MRWKELELMPVRKDNLRTGLTVVAFYLDNTDPTMGAVVEVKDDSILINPAGPDGKVRPEETATIDLSMVMDLYVAI